MLGVLREQEAGAATEDVCRRHGISQQNSMHRRRFHWRGPLAGGGRLDRPAAPGARVGRAGRELHPISLDAIVPVSLGANGFQEKSGAAQAGQHMLVERRARAGTADKTL
jgi:hypothetical protein